MKKILIFILLFWSIPVFSQDEIQSNDDLKEPFIRIFNSQKKKIDKGRFLSVSPDYLELNILKGSDTVQVSLKDISYIITKRSTGHSMLIGAAAGMVVGSTLVALTYDPDQGGLFNISKGDMILMVGPVFGLGGTIVGAIVSEFNKSALYRIDGSAEKMKDFKNGVSLSNKPQE
ncbi:hypothetical protein [Algoriphagus machipongonensis]|uniref:Peptidase S1 and S6, chymotrypsin/Hap:PDZ/DHR/GLGF n=1 Tax=Algoriphagus machipongonensis TaxID=388413 RepID=A3HTU2_9BACT|nr:hypothetical protein [Algoriphagus machipongonensis]EAZ83260.1 putative peptidase S1 and S6, chymotrypsin/Hap:PDZ/DHR/GLGF [Algoriphagus machipongonensis]